MKILIQHIFFFGGVFFFCLFRATPAAYGGSQARGLIGATASGLCQSHSNARAIATPDPSHVCDQHHGSWQHWILNPLSEARGRTHVLMVTSRVCNLLVQWELPRKAVFSTLRFFSHMHYHRILGRIPCAV